MPSKYNGLLDSERLALVAMRNVLRGQKDKPITEQQSPEAALQAIVVEADLSHSTALDTKKVLAAHQRIKW